MMHYLEIAVIACLITYTLAKKASKHEKFKELINLKEYKSDLGLLYVSLISTVVILVCVTLGKHIDYLEKFKIFQICILGISFSKCIEIIISSGLYTIIIMIISNELIHCVLKKRYTPEGIEEARNDIVTLYSLNMFVCMTISALYLESVEMAFTYFSILLGKVIWFDGKSIREQFSGIEFFERVYSLCQNHNLAFVGTVFVWIALGVGLLYEKEIGKVVEVYIVCIGSGLGGLALIVEGKIKK